MKLSLLVLIVLGLILAGCSESGNRSAATASELVTVNDAQQILGGAARLGHESQGEAESLPGGREKHCEYVGPGGATLNVVIVTAPSEDAMRKAFAEVRSGLSSFQHVEELTGIGDEAFLAQGPSSRRLAARKGTVMFLLDARRDNGVDLSVDEMKKTATHLAGQL